MAKTEKKPATPTLEERVDKLEQRLAALEASTTQQVTIPSPKDLKGLSDDQIKQTAVALQIDPKMKVAALRKVLMTIAKVSERQSVTAEEAAAALTALGVKVPKGEKETLAALREYISAEPPKDEDESEDEESDDEDESEDDEDDDEEDSDDEESDEEDDDDEEEAPAKPKKGAKKPADDDEEDEDDESEDEDEEDEDSDDDESEDEDEDEEEDAKPAKGKAKAPKDDDEDEEESEDEDEDEESDDDDADDDEEDSDDEEAEIDRPAIAKAAKLPKEAVMTKRIAALTKAGLKLKGKTDEAKYRQALEHMVSDEGTVAVWGDAYPFEGKAYCCAMPLVESKKGKTKIATCQVSGKVFSVSKDDEYTELEAE